ASTLRVRRVIRRRGEARVERTVAARGSAWRWASAAPASSHSRRESPRRARRQELSTSSSSIGFFDEDEGRPLHDRSARADERDVDVLDLALARASRRLQRALDDVPETVDAPRAQTPA